MTEFRNVPTAEADLIEGDTTYRLLDLAFAGMHRRLTAVEEGMVAVREKDEMVVDGAHKDSNVD